MNREIVFMFVIAKLVTISINYSLFQAAEKRKIE